jgi:hypothetical protein
MAGKLSAPSSASALWEIAWNADMESPGDCAGEESKTSKGKRSEG